MNSSPKPSRVSKPTSYSGTGVSKRNVSNTSPGRSNKSGSNFCFGDDNNSIDTDGNDNSVDTDYDRAANTSSPIKNLDREEVLRLQKEIIALQNLLEDTTETLLTLNQKVNLLVIRLLNSIPVAITTTTTVIPLL